MARAVRRRRLRGGRHDLRGIIASSGFDSGDRVVVGSWQTSPVGPFTDVMWVEPDGTRILLAPDDTVARFVAAIYRFERVEVVPFTTRARPRHLEVEAGDRRIALMAGRGIAVPGPRPPWLTRWVERPLAAATLGVRTWGVSPTGVEEWYQVSTYRRVRAAHAWRDGHVAGSMAPLEPPLDVGFSEPPRRPSWVALRSVLRDPTGRLDQILASLGASTSAAGP